MRHRLQWFMYTYWLTGRMGDEHPGYTLHGVWHCLSLSNSNVTDIHTHLFNGPFSGTTRVSRYQKVKTSLDFTEARDSEWQWHQLGCVQVCT